MLLGVVEALRAGLHMADDDDDGAGVRTAGCRYRGEV